MRKASRQIILKNTSPPEERVELLKPFDDIKEMDDNCKEIYTGALLKSYCKHLAKLEHLTLADWAAWYDCAGKTYVRPTNELDTNGLPFEIFIDDDHNDDDDGVSKKTCSKTKTRTKATVIRSIWFNKEVELEKHCHELITLFTPWQNEETDLLGMVYFLHIKIIVWRCLMQFMNN